MAGPGWVTIDTRTHYLEDDGVRFFLLEGDERALLIDCGMHITDARERAAELTRLPVELALTHADVDHVASLAEFECVHVSPHELCHPQLAHLRSDQVLPLWDGDVLDLGGRTLEVIALGGHTPGSVAFLDTASGALFSGDPIQRDGRIFMFGPLRSLTGYIASLRRLEARRAEFGSIWPCHGTCPVGPETVTELIAGAVAVEADALPFEREQLFGHPIRAYDVGCATLLTDDPLRP